MGRLKLDVPLPGPEAERVASEWARSQPLADFAPAGGEGDAAAAKAARAALRENSRALQRIHRDLSAGSRGEVADGYATEWFLDNYYLIRGAIRQALHDLPGSYFRELPRLADGTSHAGWPRVYALAGLLVGSGEARLDLEHAEELIEAYQRSAPLTMGELWALPALLRFVLVERLTRSMERVADGTADAARDGEVVANCVLGLRALRDHDWQRFFERLSLVERTLRGEVAGTYELMDFATRDSYRKAVERIAAGANGDETTVARAAVGLAGSAAAAAAAAGPGSDPDHTAERRAHVGYYLVAGGMRELEAAVGYRPTSRQRAKTWLLEHPGAAYLGATSLISGLLLALALRHVGWGGGGAGQQLVVLLVALVPALSIAVGLVNLAVNRLVKPQLLPKLDFSEGVPTSCRTAVVVPAMLTSAEAVDSLVAQLERHYLGNPDGQLLFALLSDVHDADEPVKGEDAALVARATAGIEELNRRYGGAANAPFYLLHRQRLWNPGEGVWMGWERKRGKLMEFNRLLRGATDTSYTVQVGDLTKLAGVRFVLTLDADTRLPPAAAHRLIGTLAHPLNRAEFDGHGRVAAGYSLLQPRTDILPESANATRFSRLFAGENGLDLYTLAVSDVYQDLFGRGIYVGKGLYDVDDFGRAIAGKVPENAVLSHDLLEGIYGGVGLVTDVVLFEDYPPSYLAQVLRMERWIRGDWQLLPWLVGGRQAAIGALGAWKVFDNLRRSLLMPSLAVMLVLGWTLLPGRPLVWTLLALGALVVPLLGSALAALIGAAARSDAEDDGSRDTLIPWRRLGDALGRFVIAVSFTLFEAVVVLRSVTRTLYRLLVSRRGLLQWRTAQQTESAVAELTLVGTLTRMSASVVLALGASVLVIAVNPAALWAASPVLALWLAAPLIAHGLGRPAAIAREELSEEQRRRLRTLARRTWLYFEQFVGPDDNWLPPDNVQMGAANVTAHRTSPTNVGLLLTSTLAAHDLGYLGLVDLSLRLRQTLEVIGRLEHYRGHLLNWYDTRSLDPLAPRYVSTVDSGNLLGSLIAVREACFEVLEQPVEPASRWGGLLDTLDVLTDTLARPPVSRLAQGGEAPLLAHLAAMRESVLAAVDHPEQWHDLYDYLDQHALPELRRTLLEAIDAEAFPPADLAAVRLWVERVGYNVRVTQREFDFLLPWHRALVAARAWQGELGPSAAAALAQIESLLAEVPTLRGHEQRCQRVLDLVDRFRQSLTAGDPAAAAPWAEELAKRITSTAAAARGLAVSFEEIARLADVEVAGADFSFLYDPERHLLHIGYNVDAEKLDDNHYDLLASEARLASLIGIAKRDLPLRHWLHLGRPLADVAGRATLMSWSGTTFEYLMPNLLMRRYHDTLLEQSCHAAVAAQVAYARRMEVPWGVSESGFGRVDAAGTFQYRAFGVPELALDRGQEEDLVIAPYASVMALDYRPSEVLENLERFEQLGALGPHGLYEALDYTPARRPLERDFKLVSSYMAHHQGMILVSLANALSGDAMVRRFHADPRIATVELLLQERVPALVPVVDRTERELPRPDPVDLAAVEMPWQAPVDSPSPHVHLLSNGHYSVLVTAAGAGYSVHDDTAITRWRDDPTLADHGAFFYICDLADGRLWSATRQPLGGAAADEHAEFSPHLATFTRAVAGILSRVEVSVADENAELRKVTLINQGDTPRRLKLTSYAEVVLGDAAGDRRHPAFSKLFVESSFEEEHGALLFRRRPRSSEESPEYAAHALISGGSAAETTRHEFETDRNSFIGRGRSVRNPVGPRGRLSNTVGATLDPVMALAASVVLPPHSQRSFTFVTAYGGRRREIWATLERLRRQGGVQRAFSLARNRSRQELRRHDLSAHDVQRFELLLSALLYPNPAMRAPPEVLAANVLGQSGLWGHGISGDHPLLLAKVGEHEDLQLVVDLVKAHGFWRRRGIKVDVVILNTKESGYSQALQGRLRWLMSRTGGDDWLDARGGIFLLREDQVPPENRVLLASVARVILDAQDGPLAKQLARLAVQPDELPLHQPIAAAPREPDAVPPVARPSGWLFDNGWGGFTQDGKEYQIYLPGGSLPPTPWSNVVANEQAGFLASEAALGSSWSVNSGENRLTPWHNDPVTDQPSEAVYLRDEESAAVWSATPLPSSLEEPFLVRHGAGYTVWRHVSHGLEQELEAFTAATDPVKLVRLAIANRSGRDRRVTVTYYAPWVLGVDQSTTRLHLVPSYDAERCALLADNRYNAEFGLRTAFLASNKAPHGVTSDRREFLGRLGDLRRPAGLARIGLSSRVQAGTDPCAALQLHLDLPAGGSEEVLFVLGQAEGREAALELAQRYRDLGRLDEHRRQATERWDDLLGKLQVHTPDPALDLLSNRWLNYQTLSARLWGRSGYYQSSGAFGFRDQLQDVLALLYTAPELAREQLLRAAAHQFEEGDVLHWWHPPSGRGVRTKISDDLLWLPYVAARYIEVTGDESVLHEEVPFLSGAPLGEHEHERYDHYHQAGSADLLEHCRRALGRGATEGSNGLPLIGGGDWNDGMNRVGALGRGESVWLAWFLIVALRGFAGLLRRLGREVEAAEHDERAERYVAAARASAWDGEWYLRAFYDDGSTLGSHSDLECRIDSIAQSWSVLALGDHARGRQALEKVDELLVDEQARLIRLFSPAFDRTPRDPGYIKGYLPGVRENGGQYTHGAIWTAWAFAKLGMGERAHQLYTLLTPLRHGATAADVEHYQVEPYVIAADVYGREPHVGRGGWTWYTGSAAWFYRLAVEAILGLEKRGDVLRFEPQLPPAWSGYSATWRVGGARYRIRVEARCADASRAPAPGATGGGRQAAISLPRGQATSVVRVSLDGRPQPDLAVPLIDDGEEHLVVVEIA